ncbi:MAG: rhomboid family intramembrane serine protease [Planctomycetota bacterium]
MFIPIGTDQNRGRRAIVVPVLVAVNLLIYFGGWLLARQGRLDLEGLYDFGHITAHGMRWWQPFSYQFLHDPRSMGHVLSNMVFLWAFGAVVEGRLGRVGFLALYLAGGALAGLVQVWVAGGSAIGASGSVSVVAGAFLALHPRGNVHGIWLLPLMRVAMPAAWLLGLYAAIDLVDTCLDAFKFTDSGVGTIAHLSGLAFGLVVCVALLGTGVLKRNDFDLFFLIRQWRRRRQLRAAAQGLGVGVADGPVAARVAAGGVDLETPGQRALRSAIAAAHRERDYTLAANLYKELLASLPTATLPAALQIDVANELAARGDDRTAATAYERYLERFAREGGADDARLMLGVILVRRLREPARARAALEGLDPLRLEGARRDLLLALRAEAQA